MKLKFKNVLETAAFSAIIGGVFFLAASVFFVQLAQYGWVMP